MFYNVNIDLNKYFYEARLERDEKWGKILAAKNNKCDMEFWSDVSFSFKI